MHLCVIQDAVGRWIDSFHREICNGKRPGQRISTGKVSTEKVSTRRVETRKVETRKEAEPDEENREKTRPKTRPDIQKYTSDVKAIHSREQPGKETANRTAQAAQKTAHLYRKPNIFCASRVLRNAKVKKVSTVRRERHQEASHNEDMNRARNCELRKMTGV